MTIVEVIQTVFITTGAAFYVVGTVGMLRFPDVFTRVHALTKTDNLGLGLVVLGLLPSATRVGDVIEMLVIWLLVLAASATSGHLVARRAKQNGMTPWRKAEEASE